jgi:hypothetical protein
MFHPVQPSDSAQATALVIAYNLVCQTIGTPDDEKGLEHVRQVIAETAHGLLTATDSNAVEARMMPQL